MKNLYQANRQKRRRSLKFSMLLGVILFSVTTVCAQPASLHDFWKENSNWNLHVEERLNNVSGQYEHLLQSPDSLTSIEKTDRSIIGTLEHDFPGTRIHGNCSYCSHRREMIADFSNMPGLAELSYIFRTDFPRRYSIAVPHNLFRELELAGSTFDAGWKE